MGVVLIWPVFGSTLSHSPTRADHGRSQIEAPDPTLREDPPVPITNLALAGDFPIPDQANQRERRVDPTSVFLTVADAGLFGFEGVNVLRADLLSGDHDGIAIDNPGNA